MKKFVERFKDPLEYIRLKSILILLGCLIILVLERRF